MKTNTDGLTMNQLAERNAECATTIAALAVENARLKSVLNDTLQPDAAVLERNHRVRALDAMKTPATDAFLAEVRAQGVEMFGSTTIQFGEEEGDEDIVYAGNQALLFAAQLRREASQ